MKQVSDIRILVSGYYSVGLLKRHGRRLALDLSLLPQGCELRSSLGLVQTDSVIVSKDAVMSRVTAFVSAQRFIKLVGQQE